ncbi:MAG TPA: hypothetical protein VK623_11950 [Flavobacterium sp.]|nr:hypothetical protein [Flavobacterium sp.]
MENTSQKTSRTRISTIIIFVVTFAIAFFGTKYLFSGNAVDRQLKKTAIEMNKKCPVNVDNETRLDSVASHEGAQIQYNYTLLNHVKEDTTIDYNAAKKYVLNNAQQNLDTNPQMEDFRKHDVAMKYRYNDKNGKFLFDFTIKAKQEIKK